MEDLFGLEIIGQTKQQGAMFRFDGFVGDNLSDRPPSHFPVPRSFRKGEGGITKQQLLPDKLDVVKTVIGATLFDYLCNQIVNKRRVHTESFPIANAPVQQDTFSKRIYLGYNRHGNLFNFSQS